MSTAAAPSRPGWSLYAGFAAAIAVSLPWTIVWLSGTHPGDVVTAILAGTSILGAAFLLSWGVEAAEADVPRAVAVSVLALVAVLPEYAVDATFAWKAATDPQQAHYAIANMTGGNRLLLGVGWSTLVFVAWARFKSLGIRIPRSSATDLAVLMIASAYAIVPVMRGALTLLDTAFFVSLYVLYVFAASRSERLIKPEPGEEHGGEEELVGPAILLGRMSTWVRRGALVVLLLWATASIFVAAEPFAEALVHSGKNAGINEFLLVQWVAPLASEAPEFVVACLLVLGGHMSKGMMTLLSSKVNQWTLLVGTLPLVTSIAGGGLLSLEFDTRQQEEVLLTLAQSLFGVSVLSNRHLSRGQAIVLASLFIVQALLPWQAARLAFSGVYLILAVGIWVVHRPSRMGLMQSFRLLWRVLLNKPA